MLNKFIILILFILLLIYLIIKPNEKFGINPLMFLTEIKESKHNTVLKKEHINKMENVLNCYRSNDYHQCIKKKVPFITPIR